MAVEQNDEQLSLCARVDAQLADLDEEDASTIPFKKTEEEMNAYEEMNSSFWGVRLEDTATYEVPWISTNAKNNPCKNEFPWVKFWNCRLTKNLGSVVYENAPTQALWWPIINETHKETYYSQKVLPWTWLEKYCWLTWRHIAEDWTVRDGDWYIVVACNYLPRFSTIMTTLWPWKVYDTWWMKWNHIDIYVDR